MIYNNFEDLPVWQKSRKFVNKIYNILNENTNIKRDYAISDQLKRCSYSIMLNIAEGFERNSNKEFANFLNIAKGSSGEVRSILYILVDNKYIDENKFKELYDEIRDISTNISNFRKFILSNYIKK